MPSVTVLMPVYNGERHLRAAIDSVLAQSHADFEFLIMNDGSTDASLDIIRSYADPRIRLVHNRQNQGLARTLNDGLALAGGEIIARQDQDDIAHPQRLERQLIFLGGQPDVALLGTWAWVIDQEGRYRGLCVANQDGRYRGLVDPPCDNESIRWELLFDNCFIHSSVMFRKKVICDALGGYDATLPFCHDYDLWSRVALRHRVANLPQRLMGYRMHPGSMTADKRQNTVTEENRHVIKRNLNALFGEQSYSDAEADLIARFRLGYDEEALKSFLRLFARLIERYRQRFPQAGESHEFRWAIAGRYAKLAFKVLQTRPRFLPSVLADCLFHYPVLSTSLRWLGIQAMTALGRASMSADARMSPYK